MRVLAVLALAAVALAGAVVSLYPLEWVLALAGAGLAYGALSPLLHARRLLFMAGAAPHAALAAASLGATLGAWGFDPVVSGLVMGLAFIYTAGYAVYRGVDPDTAASLLAGFTASLGVAGLYLASSLGVQVSGIIIGDPLLASTRESMLVLALGLTVLTIMLWAGDVMAYIGVDRDDAALSGARVWVYDGVLYTLIAVLTVGLIGVVGFILEHVLLLIPGALVLPLSRGVRPSTLAGGLVGLIAGLGGLLLGGATGLPPAAVSGLILMAGYSLVLLGGGRGG
ncbi:MAG: metal ABC transporter permease [Desulfurococcales archaeon]|nr:metal ABC transporter permease [Desulfurococcales archaeon]